MKKYRMFLQTASNAANAFSFMYGVSNLYGMTRGMAMPVNPGRELKNLDNHLQRDIGLLD